MSFPCSSNAPFPSCPFLRVLLPNSLSQFPLYPGVGEVPLYVRHPSVFEAMAKSTRQGRERGEDDGFLQ